MKIGILTLPLHTNYGGILQAYALQTILERMGHKVVILDKNQNLKEDFISELYSIYYYLRYQGLKHYKSNRTKNIVKKIREQYTSVFINKHLNLHRIDSLVSDCPKNLDAIIVGSDQIWRRQYFVGAYSCGIENAYLKFYENTNVLRVSYAASFGSDIWEYGDDETCECKRLLKLFTGVSVREYSGKKLCEEYLDRKNVKIVLDPTLLLDKEDYVRLLDNNEIPASNGSLMTYILDESEEKEKLISTIARERNLIPFRTNQTEDEFKRNKNAIQPQLEKWIRGFMDASFVVTDSFHACVFSIIFGKPFVVVGNRKRGLSRFSTLLSILNLENNLIYTCTDYKKDFSYEVPVDVKEIISRKKEESLEFLKQSLGI